MIRKPRLALAAPLCAAAALGLVTIAAIPAASAKTPDPAAALRQAALQGKNIFNHDKFGGTRTCSACHINSGVTAGRMGSKKIPSLMGVAAKFPKYKAKAHRVVTLTAQLDHCIKAGLGGTPPAATSKQMTDLITYLTKLSQGATMGKQFK